MARSVGRVSTVTQLPDGDRGWEDLNNLAENDDQSASCSRLGFLGFPAAFQPNSLQIGFNFPQVPVGSELRGISVTVRRQRGRSGSDCADGIVRLTVNGEPFGPNRAAGRWPLNEGAITYGGEMDDWGARQFSDAVEAGNAGSLGLRFRPINCNNETIRVDLIICRIFYRWSDIFVRQDSTWVRSYPEIQQAGVMRPPISAFVRKNGVWVPVYLG